MSIYGSSYSKMKSGATVIDLRYSTIEPTWNIPNVRVHQSILNKKRHFTVLYSDKSMFKVTCNIWKNADPTAVMQSLLSYRQTTVNFMPHQDSGAYIQTASGSGNASFFIVSMTPYYLSNEPPQLEDRLLIVFKSKHPTQVPGAFIPALVDESGDFLVDESGNKLVKG